MATTRRFGSIRELLTWRKRHPTRIVTGVTVTSKAPPPVYTKRQLVLRFAHWGIANTGAIHYAETRPYPLYKPLTLPRLPFTTDCSGFA